jgi:hypothetical protein
MAAHPGRMSLNQVFEVICGVHHRQVIGFLEARLFFRGTAMEDVTLWWRLTSEDD